MAVLHQRAQVMITGDAQLCEEPMSITIIPSFLDNLVEIIREHYISRDNLSVSPLLELKPPKIHFDPDLGPNDVIRMAISEQWLYRFFYVTSTAFHVHTYLIQQFWCTAAT